MPFGEPLRTGLPGWPRHANTCTQPSDPSWSHPHERSHDVTPSPQALDISARTGKPAEIVQLILDNSTEHFLAGEHGPIIAWHTLGYQLTSAGIDRAGADGAWLLPEDPDASARALRDRLHDPHRHHGRRGHRRLRRQSRPTRFAPRCSTGDSMPGAAATSNRPA
jgi:hypothetical protein